LLLQEQQILYTVSIIAAFIVLKYLKRSASGHSDVELPFYYTMMSYILVGKGSYILFHWQDVIRYPMSVLYFDGGVVGWRIADLVSSLVFYCLMKKQQIRVSMSMVLTASTLLTFNGVYEVINGLRNDLWPDLLAGIISSIFVIIILIVWTHIKKALLSEFFYIWILLFFLFVDYFKMDRSIFFSNLSGQQVLEAVMILLLLVRINLKTDNNKWKRFNGNDC
jgi:hypothetical protein